MSPTGALGDVLVEELASWPGTRSAVAVVDQAGGVTTHGDPGAHPWASVSKLLTALTVLDLAREGVLDLDEPAGPPGSTVRHLLAHASGLAADAGPDLDRTLAQPGRRRVYSNSGYELLGRLVTERAGAPFSSVVGERVLTPLAMGATTFMGSPAHGAVGAVTDLARLAADLLVPQVLDPGVVEALRTPAYAGLAGVLPGFGRQEPNTWGLGAEVRAHKAPHWTGTGNAPDTFGHFGQSGSFLWVDRAAGLACVSVGDMPFGPWAAEVWPALSDRVLAHLCLEET